MIKPYTVMADASGVMLVVRPTRTHWPRWFAERADELDRARREGVALLPTPELRDQCLTHLEEAWRTRTTLATPQSKWEPT